MPTPAQALADLEITLPEPPKAVASYVGHRRAGDLLHISGQLPFRDGKIATTGLLGAEVALEDGVAAARLCAINLLAQLSDACGGDLGRVTACIRLGGFVASAPGFHDQPKVINGASDLIVQVFGREVGAHARAAVGVAALPLGAAVEVEGLFQVRA